MIAIVSSAARERSALAALCEDRQWTVVGCDTLRAFRRLLNRSTPEVVITRGKLADGFCDQIFNAPLQGARTVVLIAAGTASAVEARLVTLGADCVLRDPVRTDVLTEYVAKYLRSPAHDSPRPNTPKVFHLAGMKVAILERQLHGGMGRIHLTPREVALAQLLVEAEGEVVTYEALFHELLGRRFKGDTSNMRVLLKKLASSAERAGADLRQWIEVIPKTGYRYVHRSRAAANAPSTSPA